MKKLFIFTFLIVISTSSFSGKLDDIQDSLDEIQNRQRINDVLNELELNRIRTERINLERQRDNLERQKDLDELNRLQMSVNREYPIKPRPIRKFKNNECVIPSGLRQTQYILKIISFDNGLYTTNHYSTTTEGWISKKTKVTLMEDFSKKDGEYINEKYVSVTCPNFDSVLNIEEFVKNMGKSK